MSTRTIGGRCRAVGGIAVVLVLFSAGSALAHDRTTSYSGWNLQGRDADVAVRLTQLDVSRFPWATTAGQHLDRLLGAYLTSHLQLLAGDEPCPVIDGPHPRAAAPGRVLVEWRVRCPDTGTMQIRSSVLLEVAPGHLHFARVTRDGTQPLERVLSDRERSWALDRATPESPAVAEHSGTPLVGYVVLGIEHILTGYDHLAFVLALLLIGGSLGEVAKVVTGFTVAHSLTLALTVLGYVHPETAPVEALIGLSIALVATENVWLMGGRSRVIPWLIASVLILLAVAAARGHGRVPAITLTGLALFVVCYFGLLARARRATALRWAIAFVFGLVHGFGFAGVLVEVGLPTDRLVAALLGFNVGVEIGQLAVVALLWPILRWLSHRSDTWRLAVLNYGSVAVLSLGVFWFVSRTFG